MNSDLLGCTIEVSSIKGVIRGRVRGIGMRPSDGEIRIVLELEDGHLRDVPANGATVTARSIPGMPLPVA